MTLNDQQVFEGYQLGNVNQKAQQSLAGPKVGVWTNFNFDLTQLNVLGLRQPVPWLRGQHAGPADAGHGGLEKDGSQ